MIYYKFESSETPSFYQSVKDEKGTYSKQGHVPILQGILTGTYLRKYEFKNKKGMTVPGRSVLLYFEAADKTAFCLDILNFTNTLYFLLNSLGAITQGIPVTLECTTTQKGEKIYSGISVTQIGTRVRGLMEYSAFPKPDISLKKDGTKIYDDTDVVNFWSEFLLNQVKNKCLKSDAKPIESVAAKRKELELDDFDAPYATTPPKLAFKEDDLPF